VNDCITAEIVMSVIIPNNDPSILFPVASPWSQGQGAFIS